MRFQGCGRPLCKDVEDSLLYRKIAGFMCRLFKKLPSNSLVAASVKQESSMIRHWLPDVVKVSRRKYMLCFLRQSRTWCQKLNLWLSCCMMNSSSQLSGTWHRLLKPKIFGPHSTAHLHSLRFLYLETTTLFQPQ